MTDINSAATRTSSARTENFRVPPPPESGSAKLSNPPGYRLEKLIGRGGMGFVYEATQVELQRRVAIKFLNSAQAFGEEAIRFRTEAETAANLRHPNIVQIIERGDHDGRPYLVMEYVDGGTLAERLASGPLSPNSAALLVRTLALAVHYAHQQGIIHRDLKPANVLVVRGQPSASVNAINSKAEPTPDQGPHSLIKVADFGLAKRLDQSAGLTQSGAVVGTPMYMAPEQAEGRNDLGVATDVYALGVILYECLTGKPPFRAATSTETMDQVRTAEPASCRRVQPSVPRDLDTVCLKCLEKSPSRRYASAHELADDLHRFLSGQPVTARPVGVAIKFGKWAKRRPAAATAAGLGLLAVVGGIVGVVVHNRQLKDEVAKTLAAQKKTEAQFDSARKSLRQMLDRTRNRSVALAMPEANELLRQQQDDALQFFRSIGAHEESPSQAVLEELADAVFDLGMFNLALTRRDDAIRLFREADQLYGRLLVVQPDNRRIMLRSIDASAQEGYALGPSEDALAIERITSAIQRGIGRLDSPSDRAELSAALAKYHNYRGMIHRQKGRLQEAEADYRRSVEIRSTILPREPKPGNTLWMQQGEALANIGLVCDHLQRPDEAAKGFDEAEHALSIAERDVPGNPNLAAARGAVCINRGLMFENHDKPDDAIAEFEKAIHVMKPAWEKEPNFLRLRLALFNAVGAKSAQLSKRQRWAEAAEGCAFLTRVSAPDKHAGLWVQSAALWLKAGRNDKMEDALNQAKRSPNWPAAKKEIDEKDELAALRGLSAVLQQP